MTDKPEALRLAERIEKCDRCGGTKAVAAELRRLHKVNQELLEALRLIEHATSPTHDDGGHHEAAYDIARAAIAKTEGQK